MDKSRNVDETLGSIVARIGQDYLSNELQQRRNGVRQRRFKSHKWMVAHEFTQLVEKEYGQPLTVHEKQLVSSEGSYLGGLLMYIGSGLLLEEDELSLVGIIQQRMDEGDYSDACLFGQMDAERLSSDWLRTLPDSERIERVVGFDDSPF